MKLADFRWDEFSQFGEDGIIAQIFDVIGTSTKFCVEFGASDGLSCSNVAHLWKNGWSALLIEGDEERFAALEANVGDAPVTVLHQEVKPSGASSIDEIVKTFPAIDFMAIDVDGNDYHIWYSMKMRPRVLCIEFNPTIPPHVSVFQEYDAFPMGFGASLRALFDLSFGKGYRFVGATACNAFFVLAEYEDRFADYERDPMVLFPLTNYTFLVSDFTGRSLAAGAEMPWGIHSPYVGPAIVGEIRSITNDPKQTMDAYEAKYGTVVRWYQHDRPNIADPDQPTPEGATARAVLIDYMQAAQTPICIAIDHLSNPYHVRWVRALASRYGYQYRLGGGAVTLVRDVA